MKHFYFLLFLFTINIVTSQTTVGFEIGDNWSPSPSGYGDYVYTEGDFTASGISILKESSGTQDGYPKTIDNSSVRLRNNSTSSLTIIISTGGVSDFSFKVRRWDGSPATNFIVETTIDNGVNWNSAGIIDETLTVDGDWKTFNGNIDSANSNVGVRIASQGTTERIMVDNFTWNGFSTSCGLSFGAASISCQGNTIGDNNDLVTVNIPYTSSDAGVLSVTTTSGGIVGGDDPSTTPNGTIVITDLLEGSAWDIILNGGDCDGTSNSGTIGVDICDPTPNSCFDLSGGTESFELVAVATNSDGDAWTNTSGSYTMNGYCGGSCTDVSDTWLIFGPLNTTQTSDLALAFDASKQYSQTDLIVAYTTQYDGCPGSTQWTTASTLTDSGAAEINLSAAQGSDVYIGIQYYEDGTGGSSGWTLTNVAINSFGDCPVLGTINPSDCAVCDMSLGSADYTCSTNTAGDNNDAVTITIPYTGSESTLVSVTTSTTGTVGGNDPTTVIDGSITITGLNEGDAWDITLNGGDCDGTTISGTVPAAVCDPITQNLIINEVLADPGSTSGDANNDGIVSTSQDEFVEMYNNGSSSLDLSGWTMEDGNSERHVFPSGTVIEAGEFLVLFGGGSVDNFNGNGQISSTGSIGLNNGGDDVIIKNNSGVVVVSLNYTGASDQSVCRNPDFTGDFVGHLSLTENPVPFSPGQLNSQPLSTSSSELNIFNLFPNPTNTGFVTIKSNQMGAVQAQVFDLLGKEVINTAVNNERLDVSNLNAGVYVVKLMQNKNTSTKKLIIQ
ncbi:lamin tail domain-containing protein [Flavobacteriaceae bacterium]|nr:lamin tail domain-containing protein [Flavobacteriaceae bacterium]